MKLQQFFPLFLILGFTASTLSAQNRGQETAFSRELNTRDDTAVREFVESKENIIVKDKSKNLEISGDVRFEYQNIQEKGKVKYAPGDSYGNSYGYGDGYGGGYGKGKKDIENKEIKKDQIFKVIQKGQGSDGIQVVLVEEKKDNEEKKNIRDFSGQYRYLRGGHHVNTDGIPFSVNDFDVEANLKIKYTYEDAWAMMHLQFDNPAGIRGKNKCKGVYPVFNKDGSDVVETFDRNQRWVLKGSGEGGFISLKRAFIGYNAYADGKHRFDIEIGRRKLNDIFDSEISFTSRFDGILLRYASAVDEIFDWYATAGAFVIDENVNHFGYAGEVGFLDIYETGIDLRYNIIDWRKKGKNRCTVRNPLGAEYLNSQVTFTYTFAREFCKIVVPFEFYSGFLINHAAKKTIFTKWKKKNLGWYAGLLIGNVDKKGDWCIDIEYVVAQAQAVPEYDIGSIGRGNNVLDENLFDFVHNNGEAPDFSKGSFSNSELVGYFPRRGNGNFIGWRFEFLYAITDNFSLDLVYEFSNQEDKRIGGRHFYRNFKAEAMYAF